MYDFMMTSVFKRRVFSALRKNCLVIRKGREVNGKIAHFYFRLIFWSYLSYLFFFLFFKLVLYFTLRLHRI